MKEPNIEIISQDNAGYCHLLDSISTLWSEAKERAIVAVNTELLDTNWKTGQYIVEYEQGGKARAEYGKQLLTQLAKDLTARHGKGFNRSNLTYMRKSYLAFPKCETLSHKLTWCSEPPRGLRRGLYPLRFSRVADDGPPDARPALLRYERHALL